jgi:hypothetical protein
MIECAAILANKTLQQVGTITKWSRSNIPALQSSNVLEELWMWYEGA